MRGGNIKKRVYRIPATDDKAEPQGFRRRPFQLNNLGQSHPPNQIFEPGIVPQWIPAWIHIQRRVRGATALIATLQPVKGSVFMIEKSIHHSDKKGLRSITL